MENENVTTIKEQSVDEPKCVNHNDDFELEELQMEIDAQRQYEACIRRAFMFPY